MKHASILIVEDEAIVAKSIEKRLVSLGYTVVGSVATGTDALVLTARTRPDLILMDIRLRGTMDGIRVARIVLDWFGTPVIFVTAFADSATIERANETGHYGYLIKPFGEKDFLSTIGIALSRVEREKSDADEFTPGDARSPATVDNDAVAMAAIDPDKKIILVNSAFEKLTGCSRTEIAGIVNLSSLIEAGNLENVSEYLRIFQIDPTLAPEDIKVRMKTGFSPEFPVTLRFGRIEGTFLVAISFLTLPSGLME
jgi:PAS domain S-box-containing protein